MAQYQRASQEIVLASAPQNIVAVQGVAVQGEIVSAESWERDIEAQGVLALLLKEQARGGNAPRL